MAKNKKKQCLSKFINKKLNEPLKQNNIFDYITRKIKIVNNETSAEIEKTEQAVETPVNESECEKKVFELENQLTIEKKKNEKLVNDLKRSMALLKESSSINLDKDIQIGILNKKIGGGDQHDKNRETLFKDFEHVLESKQLKELRSIRSGQSGDSTFILKCMKFFYPDRSKLDDRSVTGRQNKKIKKQPITPSKLKMITRMLSERIESENGVDDFYASKRLGRIKKLICDAISKLKTKKTTQNSTDHQHLPNYQPYHSSQSYNQEPSVHRTHTSTQQFSDQQNHQNLQLINYHSFQPYNQKSFVNQTHASTQQIFDHQNQQNHQPINQHSSQPYSYQYQPWSYQPYDMYNYQPQ